MEAITREEKLMDGQDVKPITRKEKILAGEDLKTITREEYFLKKYRGGGGGDITVESLNVTENGTYTAPTGKAYTPVKVELPLDSKTITENGTYTASDDNLAGFNEVTVSVEGYAKKSLPNTPTPIATFNASALPMPSLKIGIEAVQSGTGDPSPTNVRPISGWSAVNVYRTGINIWDEEWEIGTISTSTGEYSPSGDRVCSKNYIRVEPNEVYYKQNFAWQFYYDEYKNFISAISIADGMFATPNNAHYMKFYTSSAYGQTYNNDISINYPSTDTSYHAYNGTTYTTALKDGQGNPMTCYGGTLDVVSGVLTVDRAYVDLGDLSQPWGYVSNGNRFTNNSLVSLIKTPSTDGIAVEAITSQLKVLSLNDLKGSSNDALFAVGDTDIISVRYTSCGTDTEAIKTALTGVELVYKLATPQTYQLTPTAVKSLLGTNNLWADSGDMLSGEYLEAL